MILLVAVLLALPLGLVLGGRLERLGQLGIKGQPLVLVALLLQIFLMYGPWLGSEPRSVGPSLMVLSYLPLLAFVWLNRKLTSVVIIGAGMFLNFVAIATNGGYMPTSPEALARMGYDISDPSLSPGQYIPRSKDMVMLRAETRLWLLTDTMVSPRALPWVFVFSIGDIIASIGVVAFILGGMLRTNSP
jgi:hypothetical protein